ncbi:MAG: 5-formyltetrahydrofolate cyclo-ligase [bacterium]
MKLAVRKRIREAKVLIGTEKLAEMSIGVEHKIEGNLQYQNAAVVMLFSPLWDEVDVKRLFERAFDAKKRVILPTIVNGDIVPVELKPDTEWRVGKYNIDEPMAEPYDGEIDLVIVPGVAFDADGNRLGRGKGFYDRFLINYPNAYKIGVGFEFQLVDEIPTEPFDIKMDEVIVI